MKLLKNILFSAGITFLLASCNLEKEIDLDLPVYVRQPVVECYLEPGQPFNLLLTRSSSYFDPFQPDSTFLQELLIDSADVRIIHQGKTYQLNNGLFFNHLTFKVYNYGHPDLVPFDYDHTFELKITLKDGSTIESTTRILPPVPIDSIVVEFEAGNEPGDTMARVLTYLTDDPGKENFFRRQFHHKSLLDSIPEQDFLSNDKLIDNQVLAFGTGFSYPVGDTVYNTIYHLTPEYYDFLKSVFIAGASNGNPFGQPSVIVSSVSGTANPVGIFTGLSYVREMTVISK